MEQTWSGTLLCCCIGYISPKTEKRDLKLKINFPKGIAY
jgi:hypothetical protein